MRQKIKIKISSRCFMETNLDMLVCGNFILYKNKQNTQLIKSYKNKIAVD